MTATLTANSTCLVLPRKNELRVSLNPQSKKQRLKEFMRICRDNPDMRIEMDKNGEVIIMPPAHSETGEKNAELTYQLKHWAKKDGRGKVYDSSAGFRLPNGAVRSPDASWILKERLQSLDENQRQGFMEISPDFVIELLSSSDSLKKVKAKMLEYLENGTSLGWLIDARKKRVYIYRQGKEVEVLEKPQTVCGESLLPDFQLNLNEIF